MSNERRIMNTREPKSSLPLVQGPVALWSAGIKTLMGVCLALAGNRTCIETAGMVSFIGSRNGTAGQTQHTRQHKLEVCSVQLIKLLMPGCVQDCNQ